MSVSNTNRTGDITGKINADPNPIPFGHGCVLISWETNDLAGAEVRVSTSSGEKIVSRKRCGQKEIGWIVGSTAHDFRLYAASQPTRPIDSVRVRREGIPHKLATEVMQGKIDIMQVSQFIAAVMPCCLRSGRMREIFPIWQRRGFHVTPLHFYQPIPDTRTLSETLWDRPSELVGIDMNDAVQLDLLRKHFPKFWDEYEQFPIEPSEGGGFYLNNGLFDGADALVAYCMVRQFQPRRIIEIGGGFSSLILGEAAAKNGSSPLICIEPFPTEFLRKEFPGLQSLIEKKVQDIDLEFFSQLESGDILFIDSSHTVKIGGDVNYLFLEVLPRLKPGVIVHVHDIFLPCEYPRDWVTDEFRFWSEQYLLQAFLSFNSEFEVLIANRYLAHRYPKDLKAAFSNLAHRIEEDFKAVGSNLANLKRFFPNRAKWSAGSFWMRRRD